MGRVLRYSDSAKQCWSRADLDNGDPIWISVAQSGVVVKRSRMGIMGPRLYEESNVYKAATTAQVLDGQIAEYTTPAGITNPVLRAFTQAAIDAESAAQLSIRLNRAVGDAQAQPPAGMTDQQAEDLVHAFAEVMAEHTDVILDAALLPASKDRIYRAFRQLIRHYEELRSMDTAKFRQHGYDQTLEQLRALHLRVADFQSIDPEDQDLVDRINAGPSLEELCERLANGEVPADQQAVIHDQLRQALFLCHKYHRRGMSELGVNP